MSLPKLSKETCKSIEEWGSRGWAIVLKNLPHYEIPKKYISLARSQLNSQKRNYLLRDSAKRNLELLNYYYPKKTQIVGRMVGGIGKDILKVGGKIGRVTKDGLSLIAGGILFVGTAPIFGSLTEPLRKDIYDKMTEPMPWYDYQTYQDDTNSFSFWSSVIASPITYAWAADHLIDLSSPLVGCVFLGGVIESGLRTSYDKELRKPGNIIGTLASKGIIYLRQKYSDAKYPR